MSEMIVHGVAVDRYVVEIYIDKSASLFSGNFFREAHKCCRASD